MQQDSIQMPIATPISGLHFQKMPGRVAHDSSGCIDSKLAAQQISVYEIPYPGKSKGPAADCTAQNQPSSVLNIQLGKTPQEQSALAMEALTGGQLTTSTAARQAKMQHPSQQQQQHVGCDSDRSSFERCNFGQGIDTEDEFRGEYAESKQGHTKDTLRQRRMDIRSSLDWDFNSHRPILVTRRSKDYGEESQRVLASSVDQGRS
ncbi:hypothetical protein ABBQ38_006679 [Trebouxia sp. C0009 RCD-2024]